MFVIEFFFESVKYVLFLFLKGSIYFFFRIRCIGSGKMGYANVTNA